MVWLHVMPPSALYALRKAARARAAAAPVAGGLPPAIVQPVFVNAGVGLTPTSPVITESVQVTAWPPRTEKLDAAPSDGADWANAGWNDAAERSVAIATRHTKTYLF